VAVRRALRRQAEDVGQRWYALLMLMANQDDEIDEDLSDLALLVYAYARSYVPRPSLVRTGHCLVPLLNFGLEFGTIFRFADPQELMRTADLLGIPEQLSYNGYTRRGIDAFAVLCARMTCPDRLSDVLRKLHLDWSSGMLSSAILSALYFLHDRWKHRIYFDERFFTPGLCYLYAKKYTEAGSVLKNLVGILDGSYLEIAMPGKRQSAFYNGHRRCHCVLSQGLVSPLGLAVSTWGPFRGSAHDMAMVHASGLMSHLNNSLPAGYYIFADKGYAPWTTRIRTMIKNPQTQAEIDFNTAMSPIRASVEWFFDLLSKYWAHLDYSQKLQLSKTPVGAKMIVCTLLMNVWTCLEGGNQISAFFGLRPPTIEAYLAP